VRAAGAVAVGGNGVALGGGGEAVSVGVGELVGVGVDVAVGVKVGVKVGVAVGVCSMAYSRKFWMPSPHQYVSVLTREQRVPISGAGRWGCRQ